MLRIGVIGGSPSDVQGVVAHFVRLGAVAPGDGARDGITVDESTDADLRSVPFVVGCGAPIGRDADRADVWLGGDDARDDAAALVKLWHRRLVPWDANLTAGTRAPRRRTAEIVEPDPTWSHQAARLMGRLEYALGDLVERIDHIGSTSVPGLAAKDLIDIQVVVADLSAAAAAADAASGAGFVRVSGAWFGPGNEGRTHREEVCVDADPGRPVNVNIRPLDSPVWRDALLFRTWLRESDEGRREYEALKRSLAAHPDLDIDGYGDAKASWVSSALARAAGTQRPS